MSALPVCMSVYHMYSVPLVARGDEGFLGIRVTDGCELLREFWEPNPVLFQEQEALITAEPTLHSPMW